MPDNISRVIFEYAARIGGAQDADRLLQLNADLARDLVGAERCSIWLADRTTNELWTKVAHGVGELRIPLGRGLVGECVANNAPIIVNDAAADSRFFQTVDQSSGFVTKSVLTLPLRDGGGNAMGALQVLNKEGGFSKADAELLGLAASYSASTIEGQRLRSEAEAARLLYHELEIARTVQQQLLPQCVPTLAGVELAAFCRPAKYVGGDYYDFVESGAERLTFTVGDVSGKGVPAAVLMASIQAFLRAQLMRAPESLAAMMADLNGMVYASSTRDRYSTLFCSSLDLATRKLTYVNAGQVVPMLLRHDRTEMELLSCGGVPVGLLPGMRYEEAAIDLGPGDTLLCCSDGITEATDNAGEMIGEERVAEVLRECADLDAGAMRDRVIAAADEFANGAEQSDDMTVVVLRVST